MAAAAIHSGRRPVSADAPVVMLPARGRNEPAVKLLAPQPARRQLPLS
jgi:hypothetical protein